MTVILKLGDTRNDISKWTQNNEILVRKAHFKGVTKQPTRPDPTRPGPTDQKKGHEIDGFKGVLSKNAEFQKYSSKSTDL